MGDEILKKIVFVFFAFLSLLLAGVQSTSQDAKINIEQYNMYFKKIAEQRVGLSDQELNRVSTPFVDKKILKIIKDKNVTENIKPIIFHLYAILNDTVRINDKWYKLGSKIYSYRIIKIKNNSVILKNKRKKIELFLRKKDDKIKITKGF